MHLQLFLTYIQIVTFYLQEDTQTITEFNKNYKYLYNNFYF